MVPSSSRRSGLGTAVGRGTHVAHGKGSVEVLGPVDAEEEKEL